MLKKIDIKGLKFKLWVYFVLFAAVIMVALWLLQIVFLKTYYQSMKTNQIKKIGDTIIAEYDKSDFQDTILKYSYNNGIVVQTFDKYGNLKVSSNMFGNMGPPHTDPQSLSTLIEKLSQSKDGKTSYITTNRIVKGQILVYGAVLPNTSSGPLYLYINSQIAPVDMTTSVLQEQLVIVMAISLLLSLVISLLIASKLARPITKITQTAAELAGGDYNVVFEAGNYSEVNQLATTLNYATAELSKTDQLRKDLIANISHDLRTPLTMVKMYAELIRDVSGDKPEKRDAHTKVIIEEADRLSVLISDMLDLSKLQSGTTTVNLKDFDLGEKAKTIINRFNVLSEHDGYIFKINCEPNVIVYADEQRIEQVIYNLVSNAVNYTGDDKTVTVNIKKASEKVRFEVKDTGHGIPKEEIKQIWERYYKATKTQHKRAVVGTGLGLSIVKEILVAHHATYGVDSTVGVGSTFWFEL
jgi:signal transduction histidine kinase